MHCWSALNAIAIMPATAGLRGFSIASPLSIPSLAWNFSTWPSVSVTCVAQIDRMQLCTWPMGTAGARTVEVAKLTLFCVSVLSDDPRISPGRHHGHALDHGGAARCSCRFVAGIVS